MFGIGAFLLLFCVQEVLAAATFTSEALNSGEASTCPYRTINYITHRLPQQCLPSSRNSPSVTTDTTKNTVTTSIQPISNPIASRAPVSDTETSTNTQQVSSETSLFTSLVESSTSIVTSIRAVTTITATPTNDDGSGLILSPVAYDDSPLESGNFLSFEEWKKQNLKKAGQSEHIGRNARPEQREPRKRAGAVHNALDSLGDDAEIDIDFSGLVAGNSETTHAVASRKHEVGSDGVKSSDMSSNPRKSMRGKEAGTTSKSRFNYASIDCAASVLKTNSEAKSPNTVIIENKDLYMLNKCSATNKHIILELCDDISIDTVVLANFEFFSSSFRTFRVGVSDKYPVKTEKWKSLGTFEARNTREVQAFLITNPVIWARYVKIEFLTHYGNEFYCPVSLVRVHGTTMMEDYKHDLAANMGEDDDEVEESSTNSTIEKDYLNVEIESAKPTSSEASIESTQQVSAAEEVQNPDIRKHQACFSNEVTVSDLVLQTSPNNVSVVQKALLVDENEHCLPQQSACGLHIEKSSVSVTITHSSSSLASQTPVTSTLPKASATIHQQRHSVVQSVVQDKAKDSTTAAALPRETNNDVNEHRLSDRRHQSNGNHHTRIDSTNRESSRTSSPKQSAPPIQPPPASPTIQESFFKSVQKRLQMLESNSSLSLQYIEDQSRTLRDAFRKVEQRQLSKTSTFLDHLNQSVANELREFRQQYDHLWQSTVIELELQRERYEKESHAMHARLGVLADELIFQRRVSMLQMMLILICLGLILFSRGGMNNYLELPLVQSVLSRSPSAKSIGMTPDSRGTTPALMRSRSETKQGILKNHSRALSEDSTNEAFSASEMNSPPTPVSYDGFSDAELSKPDHKIEDLTFDPTNLERPSTSPPVLPSLEDPTTPKRLHYLHDVSIESRMLSPSPSPSVEEIHPPAVRVEHPSPSGRHLTWNLPD